MREGTTRGAKVQKSYSNLQQEPMTILPGPGPVPACLHVFCPVWMCCVKVVGRSLIFLLTRKG